MIYSPSSRDEFSFCPRAWWLRKKGVIPRAIEYPELCAVGGKLFGSAMETWNRALMDGIVPTPLFFDDLKVHAREDWWAQRETWDAQGRTLSGKKALEFVDSLTRYVDLAIDVIVKEDPLRPYAILSAEEVFPRAGNSRLDVRVKQADGRQIVFDYKVKFGPTEEKYYKKAFEEYANGEQKRTYTYLTGTDMFGIIMVCLQPLKDNTRQPLKPYVQVKTWPVGDDEKKVWYREALLMTPEMDRVLQIEKPELVRGKTFPHVTPYGDCKYHDACIRYNLDPEKMSLDYITIKEA